MNIRDIPCSNCHKQIMVTPKSTNVRCHSCTALISIEVCQNAPNGPRSFCWQTNLSDNSTPGDAMPKPDWKPNPMINNGGGHQTKRAVLCGVNYQKRKHRLKGTINDVNKMKALLTGHFKFPETAICVLTGETNDPNLIPTKENMQKALRWLVADCKSGDSLVFYFSGHGLRQLDFNRDEIDGYDETICPSDFMTAGMILDNDINNTIVKPLKEGVKLHAIIDACRSGTILDLEHVYSSKRKTWVDNRPPSGVRKSTDGGLAISLSACADDQMAADTNAFSRNEMQGAMTYIFDQIIREKPRITYGELLDKMQEQIKHVNRTGCFLNVFRHKLIQETQLSCSNMFDIYATEFKL